MLEILRVMTDFGLLVLIWIVQLIIYPGFRYVYYNLFVKWHKRYMLLITYVVAPLMFLQAGLVAYQLIVGFNILNLVSMLLVILVWGLTFLYAVPLHNQLGIKEGHHDRIRKLVSTNWYRTIIWTILWVISFWRVIPAYLIG